MKISKIIFVTLLLILPFSIQAQSTVVLQISDMDTKTNEKLISEFANINEINLEYSCAKSGLYIFKVKEKHLREEEDIKAFFKNKIKNFQPKLNIELLNVIIDKEDKVSSC